MGVPRGSSERANKHRDHKKMEKGGDRWEHFFSSLFSARSGYAKSQLIPRASKLDTSDKVSKARTGCFESTRVTRDTLTTSMSMRVA